MRILFTLLCYCVTIARGQQKEIKVYSGPAPGSEKWNWNERVNDSNMIRQRVIYNVAQPSLTVFSPDTAIANGTAVIICPGGGFHFLAIDNEGFNAARWLAKKGITAFVLKYRLTHVLSDDPVKEFFSSAQPQKERDDANNTIVPLAIADGRAAIAWVRKNATAYKIKPNRIGIIGFSAGGTVAASAAFNYTPENRPDFVAPIYAYMPPALQSTVASDAPPLFIACASDDQLGLQAHSLELYNLWIGAKKSVEMHLYAKGGHGFGMAVHHIATDGWIERYMDWLMDLGLLK